MKANLKSLFRRAVSRRKGSESLSAPPQSGIRQGPAQRLEQQEREDDCRSNASQVQEQGTVAKLSEASNGQDGSRQANDGHSIQRPGTPVGAYATAAADNAPPATGVTPEIDESIIDDYRAYFSAVSPSSVASIDAEFMSLGGDSRLRMGASELKHNEDIANRNIDQYGKPGPQHNSLTSPQHGSPTSLHHNSPTSQQAADKYIADHTGRQQSVAGSIASKPASMKGGSVRSAASQRYTLGSGVTTEGSLVDGILPHVEDAPSRQFDRKNWPVRLVRDESHLSTLSEKRRVSDDVDMEEMELESGGQDKKSVKKKDGLIDLREAVMGGPEDYDNGLRAKLDGVVDLNDSVDVDESTTWAPAVTYEVVKPETHDIIQERIYREIHNHDVYHYVQPVYQTEFLPARHFVYDSNNELVEVPDDALPECTGANQRWSFVGGDREKPGAHVVQSPPQAREPRIISDKKYTTPAGFKRRETTILHPPELADMSGYGGPVIPVEFIHHPEQAPERDVKTTAKENGHLPDGQHVRMREDSSTLPMAHTYTGDSSSSSRTPTGSSSSSSPRLSIRRKLVPFPHQP